MTVTLLVIRGPWKGKRFAFAERTTSIVGRGPDCNLVLPDDKAHETVSRHHCLFDINPPDIRVRDLGSLNGTFVNGYRIGRREDGQAPDEGGAAVFPEYDLRDGDEVSIGETVFTVRAEAIRQCATCGEELSAAGTPEESICPVCDKEEEKTRVIDTPPVLGSKCEACGRALSGPASLAGSADFLCSECRKDVIAIIKALLAGAGKGIPELKPLRALKVIKSLGRGSAGAAFLAQEKKSGRYLALKILLPEVAVNERAQRMFLREVENSKVLRHPNVVQLYEHGSYKGVFFYTMEYCDRGCVAKLKEKRGGRLGLREATEVILQGLAGLDYIHQAEIPTVQLADGTTGTSKGLVHRDLKPANIFLAGEGEKLVAKIADVGVAKAFDTAGLSGQTRTGSVGGTPVFMPRQQVINFKYAKPDVDVWAMAATYYNLLTGYYPRDFSADKDVWLTVLQTQPLPVAQRGVPVPPKLAEVLDLALVDDPEITFKSAGDLRKAIITALKQR